MAEFTDIMEIWKCEVMRFLLPILVPILCLPFLAHAEATVEGHVKLPPVTTVPVRIQRYDVVTTGGVVAINPPLAVVYLEGQFPTPAKLPTVQMIQKNFAFVPTLLPIEVGTT